MEKLRVRVALGDALARAGLVALLSSRADIDADGGPANVAVWDLAPPAPTEPFLALVADERAAARAIAAGARAVLRRDADASTLAAALAAVARGLVVLDEAVHPMTREPADATLTPRELEVLQLIARGHANKAIARALGITEHTAKFHVNAILEKLGATTRTEAVVRAARQGLLVL